MKKKEPKTFASHSLSLADCNTKSESPTKEDYLQRLDAEVSKFRQLQELLYADGRWALLIILQGMDTSGKDGIIRHVATGVNPAGFAVYSYKRPNSTELRHDWLWRTYKDLPEKGRIGIFNRSYYEEIVAVRVHQQFLEAQKIPKQFRHAAIWKERAKAIAAMEHALFLSGTRTLKFFLHISKEEQARRLIKRGENDDKLWKFDLGDIEERAHWREYQNYWEDALRWTSTKECPWYVIPSDNKRYQRIAVASVIVNALRTLDLRYPTPDKDTVKKIREAVEQLKHEK